MKNSTIIICAILFATIFTQSCTKENRIRGIGSITTKTITVKDFSGIDLVGADNVFINYGAEQKVEVKGHSNIIERIQTDVVSGIWYIDLERGNYTNYNLTYYITLPTIEEVSITGSGNVSIEDAIETDNVHISILGSGNIYGFLLSGNNCEVDIIGSGNCEIKALKDLDVKIEGSGNVYYKGSPSIKDHISGSGRIINSN